MSDPAPPWRTIDQLARRVGGYAWLEHRVFELTGRWASGEGDPDLRVCCRELSTRHADLAARWRARLPVRAGVDADALVVAPGGPAAGALAVLEGEADLARRFGGLVTVWLPRLLAAYADDLRRARPVAEGPVMEVLRLIGTGGEREFRHGRRLLAEGPGRAEKVAEFCRQLERSFGGPADIIPDAWAS